MTLRNLLMWADDKKVSIYKGDSLLLGGDAWLCIFSLTEKQLNSEVLDSNPLTGFIKI